jgi:protocatechuate 3,4-dioxygenase, beta subunit
MMERRVILVGLCGAAVTACSGQSVAPKTGDRQPTRVRADLYQCEGCEGALERPAALLASSTRIAPDNEPGTPLIVTGTVFRTDGVTPQSGVVIYAYQTNAAGLYANGTPETEASRRHGRLRGWVRTGPDGRYRFETIKPAPYPNDTIPAHLHFTILEPGRQPYWIDDIVFSGAFGVTPDYIRSMTNKGGNGISTLRRSRDGILQVTRDIVLEPHPQ